MGYDSKDLLGGIAGIGSSMLSMQRASALPRIPSVNGTEKALKSGAGISTGAKTDSPEDVKKAGKQFESLLVQQMLQSMWQTVPKGELVSGSNEEDLYRDMFSEALGKEVSENQPMGIADAIVKDINRINERRKK